jgi:hypothetical protein
VSFYNLAGAVDLVVDVVAYLSAGSGGQPGPTGASGPSGPTGTAGNLAPAGQSCSHYQAVVGFDQNGQIRCGFIGPGN